MPEKHGHRGVKQCLRRQTRSPLPLTGLPTRHITGDGGVGSGCQATVQIHHSNSLEALASAMARHVCRDPVDPIVAERVVVSHATMQRWLTLELARANGIAANYRFELPAQFAWSMMRDAVPELPAAQPFAPDNLRWHLFDMLPGFARKPVGAPVRRYLEDGDPCKRFDLSSELARMFDRCLLYRPQWIREWEAGVSPHWQARLWQELVAVVGNGHWVHALDRFHATIDGGGAPDDWPTRVTFFAVPALSPSYLDLLRRIDSRVEVLYYLINPCRQYWGDIFTRFETVVRSGEENPGELHLTEGNELLAAWGRIGRDTFDSLVDMEDARDFDHFVEPEGRHCLAELQRDILDLKLAGDERVTGVSADGSLQIHSCHSPTREIEVLHDCLLDLFEKHADIQPADVHILTPAPAHYDAAISSVFESRGQIQLTMTRGRPVETASLRALFDLLNLVRSRCGAEEMMAPLDAPLVCRRFGIETQGLVDIRRWVHEAAIRWGIDADHRKKEGQTFRSRNTWYEGLRRLVLGYTVACDRQTVHDVAPCRLKSPGFPFVSQSDHETLGRFVSYCEAVFSLRDNLGAERKAADWAVAIHETIDHFFVPPAGKLFTVDADEVDTLRRLVRTFEDQATQGSEALAFEVVRDVLDSIANGPAPHSAWLGDGVTVSKLAEGQPLPSRIVCLVGMNGDIFPTMPRSSTFDLVTNSPRQKGDRDLRYEDRFAVLEALLAARTGLIVTYTGRNIRNDSSVPPSVVVDELADYLAERFPDSTFSTRHPLQPFDSRYFRTDTELFSYATPMCDVARSIGDAGDRHKDPGRFRAPLIVPDDGILTVSLERLEQFFANPARAFLGDRLGISLARTEVALEEEDHFELDNLQSYQLQADISAMRVDGMPPGDIRDLMMATGRPPPGEPGVVLVADAVESAQQLVNVLAPWLGTITSTPAAINVKVDDCRVTGSVPHVGPQGLVWWRPGRLRAIDRIHVHLRQLALAAAGHPSPVATALSYDRKAGVWESRQLAAPQGEGLGPWLAAYREGLKSPLPFAPKTSFEWAKKKAKGETGPDSDAIRRAVDGAWRDGPAGPGEGSWPELFLVWDRNHPVDLGFERWVDLLQPLARE